MGFLLIELPSMEMTTFDHLPLEGVEGDGADCLCLVIFCDPGSASNECCCNTKYSEHVFPKQGQKLFIQ